MNNKFLFIMNFILIFSIANAQTKDDLIYYKMDSVYLALKNLVDTNTTEDMWRKTLVTLNKEKIIDNKEDTAFKYTKLAYDSWPHEAYYADFEEDKETTKYINKIYPKISPRSYKYMLHIKDSVENLYNKDLQKLLIRSYTHDQKDRIEYDKILARKDLEREALEKASKKIDLNDMMRINQIDSIIKIYGYPGKSLVGFKYSHYALVIIQHSQSKGLFKYFEVLEDAFYKGEISKAIFALFIDRILVGSERKQLFGTQYNIKDGEILYFPIGNPELLDVRRNNFGFIKFSVEAKNLKKEMKNNLN
ncbi:MAG: DUF6624 domain-containing protein [Saprospiraceae bacterium]